MLLRVNCALINSLFRSCSAGKEVCDPLYGSDSVVRRMSRSVSASLTPLTKAISMSSRKRFASSSSSLSSLPNG